MMLWKHQEEAVDFLWHHPAAMLAMDMGTGKSRCIIEAINRMDRDRYLWDTDSDMRILIVCPKSVMAVWGPEFDKFFYGTIGSVGNPSDDLILTVLNKKNQSVRRKVEDLHRLDKRYDALDLHVPRVIVINYEAAWRGAMMGYLKNIHWDLIILDESHRIKSASGQTSTQLAKLRAERRVCLTGTPMPHSPLDIFGQARFLDPDIFGRYWTHFRADYARIGGYCVNGRPVQVLGYKNMDRFEQKCSEFTFQVKAEDVLDLPDKHHIVRECPLTPKQDREYRTLEKDFVAWLDSGATIVASNVLDKLGKLMQYTSGHARYETPDGSRKIEIVHDSKREALQDILEDLNPDDPMVVFCRFIPDLDAVAVAATNAGRECWELSGRCNELEAWQEANDGSVLAIQIQAGGVGISLVRARYCCYYSMGFSLGDYEQSLARIRRPGQDRRVTYFHLVVPNSVDEKIYRALSARKNIIDEVMRNVACFGT